MAKKKKKPFQDARGVWYHILGKRKPRPYSERALKKALKAIKRAKEVNDNAEHVLAESGDGKIPLTKE